MNLPHLASRLYGTPLLLARAKLDVILAVLGERIGWSGNDPLPVIRQARDATAAQVSGAADAMQSVVPRIAVIPVHGSLIHRSLSVDPMSGLTSYAEIRALIDAAAADPAIDGIVLDIDSPGGEASGVFELGSHIREVDAIKPVWAIACDAAYSAAYAIGAAASRLFLTQTAGVGSIGVIAMHVDQSVRDAQQGYRFTAITAGDHKNDLSPHEPLSQSAMATLQSEVDRLYAIFCDHVAAMRGVNVQAIRDTQAGVFFGGDAVNAGLADAVASLDQVIEQLSAHLAGLRMKRSAAKVIATSSQLLLPGSPAPPQLPAPDLATKPPTTLSSTSPKETKMTPSDSEQVLPEETSQATTTIDEAAPVDPAATEQDGVAAVAPVAPTATAESSRAPVDPHAQALEVAELCTLAGKPQRIASFLSQGLNPAQARQKLLAERAESPEITSLIQPDAGSAQSGAAAQTQALMNAVKRLA